MPAPIDYGVQIADPTQSFLSAFQAGTSIKTRNSNSSSKFNKQHSRS